MLTKLSRRSGEELSLRLALLPTNCEELHIDDSLMISGDGILIVPCVITLRDSYRIAINDEDAYITTQSGDVLGRVLVEDLEGELNGTRKIKS